MSLVLAPTSGVPHIAHWGPGLGIPDDAALRGLVDLQTPASLHSSHDAARPRGIVSENVSGFTGLPAFEGFRSGRSRATWAPRLREWAWTADDGAEDARVALTSADTEAGWGVIVDLELTREGVVRIRSHVTNTGDDALEVVAARSALPVAPRATELLDLTGHWSRERTPQAGQWRHGTHLRESRHGRPGHDATLVLAAGTPGVSHRRGEVWATHVAWSGDSSAHAERTPEGNCLLGGAELLGPGEVTLSPGETYTSPWLMGAWSGRGLDGVADRFHAWTRRHSPRTRRTRPVVVNTWEASYFDHDLAHLSALAEAAARVGVERFVLDDGWFRGRRDDHRGLGDWTVDPAVWPDGLHPLFDRVHELGMDVGLWVEPEMVNIDSDLARAHPDWILRGRDDLPDEWRHQQVLDLQHPDAYTHVRDALLALLDEYDVAFLKWDHNRDLVDVAHAGRPAVHGQTLAFLRLLDDLRTHHSELEIESCASGGGRIDLDLLTRADRVWPSDTIDALERQRIQRWTSLLVPPEMIGSHLGAPTAHTTGRTHTLEFRAATALIGHMGIEWDLSTLAADDLDTVAQWVALHRRMRDTIASGSLVHADHPDPAVLVTGVVAADQSEAWFVIATTDSTTTRSPALVLLPGLGPDRSYRVHRVAPGAGKPSEQSRPDGIASSGRVLEAIGIQLHAMRPESAVVLHVQARDV